MSELTFITQTGGWKKKRGEQRERGAMKRKDTRRDEGSERPRVYAWELTAWKLTGLSDPLIESRLCFPGKNTLVC